MEATNAQRVYLNSLILSKCNKIQKRSLNRNHYIENICIIYDIMNALSKLYNSELLDMNIVHPSKEHASFLINKLKTNEIEEFTLFLYEVGIKYDSNKCFVFNKKYETIKNLTKKI